MDQYASALLLFLLLLHGCIFAVDTEHALTARSFQHNGVWINKGITYSRCASTQFERRTCANFSLIQCPVTRNQILGPDCAFLLHRIACALYKINCPLYPDSSFQVRYSHIRTSLIYILVQILAIEISGIHNPMGIADRLIIP